MEQNASLRLHLGDGVHHRIQLVIVRVEFGVNGFHLDEEVVNEWLVSWQLDVTGLNESLRIHHAGVFVLVALDSSDRAKGIFADALDKAST